jgi:hypothetical protein
MHPAVKKVLIILGILTGMALVVFATAFIVFLIVSGGTDEYSRGG